MVTINATEQNKTYLPPFVTFTQSNLTYRIAPTLKDMDRLYKI